MGYAYYNGEHSITIGNQHTWNDWHLMPCERPNFSDAEPRLVFIEVPGADGKLDVSNALTGRVLYERREGSFEFYVDNDHVESWHNLYTKMKNYVQGRLLRAVLDDDPLWYYEGRFSFSEPTQDEYNMKVQLNYNVIPYKRKVYNSLEDIPWDSLTLDDVVQPYLFNNITINGELTMQVKANAIGHEAVVPTFIVDTDSEGLTMSFTNPELKISEERSLTNGQTTDSSFILSGENPDNVCEFRFSGNGTVSIRFTSGEL